jgi:hypothetical protein
MACPGRKRRPALDTLLAAVRARNVDVVALCLRAIGEQKIQRITSRVEVRRTQVQPLSLQTR